MALTADVLSGAESSTDTVRVQHRQREFDFKAVRPDDHIFRILRKTHRFYENDVLNRLLERLSRVGGSRGAAIDAGAFMGTHSVFFGGVIGLGPIVSFEANPDTFSVLVRNLTENGLADRSIPINCAVGAREGQVSLEFGRPENLGTTRVSQSSIGSVSVRMVSIDKELDRRGIDKVSLIKIDVEGAELDVLDGAAGTLDACRPLLCIEVHTAAQLREVLRRVAPLGYRIIDCLGRSPTYILECNGQHRWTGTLANRLWLWRAALPSGSRATKRFLRRLGQVMTTGWWDSPPDG